MRMSRLPARLAAALLAVALASAGALAQAAPPGAKPAVKPALTLEVKVKKMKIMGGYYLQGKPEVYKIANKNPEVLEPLFQSGETVTIQAQASGDLLTILTINGKKYEGKPVPAAK